MPQPTRPTAEPARRARDTADTLAQNLAFQDVAALTFHTYMLLRAFDAPEGAEAALARRFALALFTVTACTIFLVRGEILRQGKLRALLYRLGIFAPMLTSYFELRFLLPALQPHLLDPQLYALDRALFGTTPSLFLERFNYRPLVEWISFFYYSYFYLLAAIILPTLFFDRGVRQHQFLVGALVVCALGHVTYTLVPGAGPFRTLDFAAPLDGGFWWGQVQETVARAGAQLDIFPSLHTAYPAYFTLHAWAHRREPPFRRTWPFIAIFTAHMITATVFLRWHWFVDVLAGAALAFAARAIAVAIERRERGRSEDDDPRQPIWEPLI
jgi:hypothetical protein